MGFADNISISGPFVAAKIDGATGTVLTIAAVPGKKLCVWRLLLVVGQAATNIQFLDGATALVGPLNFSAGGGSIVLDPTALPWFETSVGNAFIITQTGTTQISGKLDYSVEG